MHNNQIEKLNNYSMYTFYPIAGKVLNSFGIKTFSFEFTNIPSINDDENFNFNNITYKMFSNGDINNQWDY